MTLEFISHSGASAGTPNGHIIGGDEWSLLLDCGASRRGATYLSDMGRPDALWLSHAHGDHCGGILEFSQRWPRVPILATATTARLLRFALGARGSSKYASRVDAVIRRIKTVPMNRFVDLPGIAGAKIMAVGAGHISGAAMAIFDVPDDDGGRRRILYTGDFCTHDQAIVAGAGIPQLANGQTIDVLISEAILATDAEADGVVWADEAQRLIDHLQGRKGPALVGVASVGESVEVATLLARAGLRPMVDEYLKELFEICGVADEDLTFGRRQQMTRHLLADGLVVAPGDQYRAKTAAFVLAGPLVDDPKATVVVLNRARAKTGAGRLLKANDGDALRWGARDTKLAAATPHFRLLNHSPRWQLMAMINGICAPKIFLVHGANGARWALKRAVEKAGFDAEIVVGDAGTAYPI